jgi:Ala-tRNA(Pro) deacylase
VSIPKRLKDYLDEHKVCYQACTHSPAYTAQGVAHAQHISGKELAKVVVVVAGDRKLMAVVPANNRVSLEELGQLAGEPALRLATEAEFKDLFTDCELGAMPPFGNLYNLEVWVDASLKSSSTITFNAGTHMETIQMSFADFERLVQPKTGVFSAVRH